MNENKASESELKVLNILLENQRELTVKEISQILLQADIRWEIRTISTFLNRLEEKKLVSHIKKGITHYYFPVVEQKEYKKTEAKSFLKSRFNGSIGNFLSAIIDDEISDKDLQEIKEWVKKLDDK